MYAPLHFEIPTPMGDLGFAPGSYVGRTRLGYASGSPAHGLGSISNNEWGIAVSAGIDPGILNTLDAMGATDVQIDELIAGDTDAASLIAHLSGTQPVQPINAGNMQYEPTDWASYGVESALADLNSDLNLLESWVATTPAIANAVGSNVRAERAKYFAWAAQYHGWVNRTEAPLADGTMVYEAGISPGQVIAIVSIAAVIALGAEIVAYKRATVAQTIAQAQAANEASILNQSAQLNQSAAQDEAQANAVRHTDPARAAQLDQSAATKRAQATQQISAAGSTAASTPAVSAAGAWAWIQQNWQLAAGAGVLAVLALKKK